MDDMTASAYPRLSDVDALYEEADMFVETEASTLVISGNPDDLVLIEKILLRLQAKKEAQSFRSVLESALETAAVN
ncbi:MAG: hypothetical protein AAFP97_09535 [Pseudomonadota bacterium]